MRTRELEEQEGKAVRVFGLSDTPRTRGSPGNAATGAAAAELDCRRWTIEEYFKVLKSGARIEDRHLDHADDLRKCLAFDAVTAWRVLDFERLERNKPGTAKHWQGYVYLKPATRIFTLMRQKELRDGGKRVLLHGNCCFANIQSSRSEQAVVDSPAERPHIRL